MNAQDRKAASEAKLSAWGIPVDAAIPTLPEASAIKLRSAAEVAKRLLILDALIATTVEEIEKEDAVVSLEDHVWSSLTKWEKDYFANNEPPTEEEIIDLGWKIEAAKVLLWSVQLLETLDDPIEEWEIEENLEEIILNKFESLDAFIDQAKLRSTEELLNHADLLFRAQFACEKDHNITPLDSGIVYERNYAFQWLIGNIDWPV